MNNPIPLVAMAAIEKIWEEEIITVRGARADLILIGQEWDYGWLAIASQNLRGDNNYLELGDIYILAGEPNEDIGLIKMASLTLQLGLSLPLIMAEYVWNDEKGRFESSPYTIAFKPRSISARYKVEIYSTGEL